MLQRAWAGMGKSPHIRHRLGWRRSGAAVAEFAVIAPVFVAFLVGAFELSRGLWAKEVLSDAARRACRSATQPSTSNATITNDINDILKDNGMDSTKATITILVNGQQVDASTAQQNDKISVKVAMPVSTIMVVTQVFLKSSTIESATVVMMRYNNN
jgi:Flp pilus assembly protein TadG